MQNKSRIDIIRRLPNLSSRNSYPAKIQSTLKGLLTPQRRTAPAGRDGVSRNSFLVGAPQFFGGFLGWRMQKNIRDIVFQGDS